MIILVISILIAQTLIDLKVVIYVLVNILIQGLQYQVNGIYLIHLILPEPEQPQKPDENDILKSLIVHYNVGKQGSNNIKTTSTLTDYSGNNRNATCKNFDWNTTEFVDEGKAMRFDGNGSCIVAVDMPQIDKYTLIVKRRWIDKRTENKWFCSLGSGDYTSASQSLFWFEGGLLNNVFYTYNRGYKNPI